MSHIGKRAFCSCRKATLLIDRQQTGYLTLHQRITLRGHLGMCIHCVRYRRQSHYIHGLLSRHPLAGKALECDAAAIAALKARILEQLHAR